MKSKQRLIFFKRKVSVIIMNTLITSIILGLSNFPFFAVIFTLPILAIQLLIFKKLNFVRILMSYGMIAYISCLLALVFFPLPSPEVAATLHSHYIQLIPFHFIADIVKESTFVLSSPRTYVTCLFDDAVLQVVFNVLMTVPFGMFLTYYCGMNKKKVILLTFALTTFIEIGQLTGLFFIYKGSYRFCDVDDLMANTLGGYLGFQLMTFAEKFVPAIDAFDVKSVGHTGHKNHSLQM